MNPRRATKSIVFVAIAILLATIYLYWYANRDYLDVGQPETLVGCNFADESQCAFGKKALLYWGSEILSKFDEGRLTIEGDPSIELYRLVMLPTFDNPIAIRIWTKGDQRYIITKRLSGSGGYGLDDFGVLSLADKRELTDREWRIAIDQIDKSEFWRLSPRTDEVLANDGAFWLIRVRRPGITIRSVASTRTKNSLIV